MQQLEAMYDLLKSKTIMPINGAIVLLFKIINWVLAVVQKWTVINRRRHQCPWRKKKCLSLIWHVQVFAEKIFFTEQQINLCTFTFFPFNFTSTFPINIFRILLLE